MVLQVEVLLQLQPFQRHDATAGLVLLDVAEKRQVGCRSGRLPGGRRRDGTLPLRGVLVLRCVLVVQRRPVERERKCRLRRRRGRCRIREFQPLRSARREELLEIQPQPVAEQLTAERLDLRHGMTLTDVHRHADDVVAFENRAAAGGEGARPDLHDEARSVVHHTVQRLPETDRSRDVRAQEFRDLIRVLGHRGGDDGGVDGDPGRAQRIREADRLGERGLVLGQARCVDRREGQPLGQDAVLPQPRVERLDRGIGTADDEHRRREVDRDVGVGHFVEMGCQLLLGGPDHQDRAAAHVGHFQIEGLPEVGNAVLEIDHTGGEHRREIAQALPAEHVHRNTQTAEHLPVGPVVDQRAHLGQVAVVRCGFRQLALGHGAGGREAGPQPGTLLFG